MNNYPWSDDEQAVYGLLIDHYDDCPWAIRDILLDESLPEAPTESLDLKGLAECLRRLLIYCNGELRNNADLIPPELIRTDRYPRVRQMRDVHQFDVGSHLALAGVLMHRRSPEFYLAARGFNALVEILGLAGTKTGWLTMMYSAVLHDFLKCFRRRRPLPSKIGKASSFAVRLPGGELLNDVDGISEEAIASLVLPAFLSEVSLSTVMKIMDGSANVGEIFYRGLGVPESQFSDFINSAIVEEVWDIQALCGLYLALIDGLAKGYARFVVTKRKKRVRSLEDVAIAFAKALNYYIETTGRDGFIQKAGLVTVAGERIG